MTLKPFAEIIALSKEKLAQSLAPIRARKVKSQAELELEEEFGREQESLVARGAMVDD